MKTWGEVGEMDVGREREIVEMYFNNNYDA